MLLSLLAAALLRVRQINPPGTLAAPVQAAFYSALGGSLNVEMRDSSGLPVPFVDAIGVKRSAVTVTLPAGTAVGLGWEITQTRPDGTNLLKPVSAGYSMVVTMGCQATESPVGTYDGSAGGGNGIATGYPAPGANTPTNFLAGVTYQLGYGAVVSVVSSSLPGFSGLPAKSNVSSNFNTFSSGGEAANSVSTSAAALTLSGGGDPSSPVCVIVTNAGSSDVWVSPYSGGHTWLCPAGATTYVPSGSTALFGLANGGISTVYCTKAAY